MASILILNGPNLNLLGQREPEIYGATTLDDIAQTLTTQAEAASHTIDFFQSNAEYALIDKIHAASAAKTDFIIINPAAFTHTSIALRDAILGVNIPFIEIHLSNVHKRETFRHHSYFSDIAIGVICGLGAKGYEHALISAFEYLKK